MLHVSPPSDVCQWYYKYDKPLLAQDRRYMKPIYRMFATCTLEWLQNKWMKKNCLMHIVCIQTSFS